MNASSITIRASLTLALLSACGGGKRTLPPGSPGAGPSNQADAPPISAPAPALPGGGERAFVADGTGLVEVATSGGSQVIAPAASWCAVDARANVVWFVAADGLRAFDLADRRTRLVVRGDLADLEVIVDWGAEQLGGQSEVEFDVAAALRLGGKPAIEAAMGCEGDGAIECFEDDLKTPKPHVVEKQRRVGALVLADPDHAAQLAARGKQGSLWAPPPPPPPVPAQKPAVDPKRCEESSTCGTLTAIPGSALWLVETANSRGDFYHETRELWDPATGEHVRRDGAKLVRSKAPPPASDADTDHGGMHVSTSGVLSFGGAVFDGAKVHYAPRGDQTVVPMSCGFAGGGWRIAGPTDD